MDISHDFNDSIIFNLMTLSLKLSFMRTMMISIKIMTEH